MEPVEVGCRGFAGHSLLRPLNLLGVKRLQLKRAMKNMLEAVEWTSRWLWIRRGDPQNNTPLGHKPGTDHPRLGRPGGGLLVGSLILIEEDESDSFSQVLLRCFLAEGVVCGHQIFLSSARDHPQDFLQGLPCPVLDNVGVSLSESLSPTDKHTHTPDMKIAWRYQNLPQLQTESYRSARCFDLSKRMDSQILADARFHSFYGPEETAAEPQSSVLGPYAALLQSIRALIQREGFDGSGSQEKERNVLRLALHSLGSALWGDDVCISESPAHRHALTTFLYALRGLLRSSLSVAMVTIPAHLIQNKSVLVAVRRLSDAAVALQSFSSSEKPISSQFYQYHGLVHIRHVPHLNCLVNEVPDNKDLAFKLKRKQFSIEKLHLPPDLSETVSRVSTMEFSQSCGSTPSGRTQLDF